jgi:hypothetical protein
MELVSQQKQQKLSGDPQSGGVINFKSWREEYDPFIVRRGEKADMKKNKLERDEYNKMQNVDMFRRRGKK